MITFASNLMGNDLPLNNIKIPCGKGECFSLSLGHNDFSCMNTDSDRYDISIYYNRVHKRERSIYMRTEECTFEDMRLLFNMFIENPDRPLIDYKEFGILYE